MKANQSKRDRSPLVVAFALAVGLIAQVFGGPLAGLVGAALGATAGSVVVRASQQQRAN